MPRSSTRSETRLLDLVDEYRADLVVLARYMQVLMDETCDALYGRTRRSLFSDSRRS